MTCDRCGNALSGSESWEIERGAAEYCAACERTTPDTQKKLPIDICLECKGVKDGFNQCFCKPK